MFIILLGLATWRISSLFVNEDGPFRVFEKLRGYLDFDLNEQGKEVPPNKVLGLLNDLLGCVWCLSIWVAAGLYLLWMLFPAFTEGFCTIFAVSAIAILIDKHA